MKTDLTGLTVGSCLLRERLSSGGYGTVYLADDQHLGMERAVKVLHPHVLEVAGSRERFLTELRISASLDHPNIVRVLYAIDERGCCGYVMEFVPGQTLRRRLREGGRLQAPLAVDVVLQAARAVHYSQSRRPPVIHQDLTPENIMMRPDGVVKVMDYGVAQAIEDPSLAVSKNIVGKPKYMSPEQFEGEVGVASDVYSLGIILYESLTGSVPFDGATPMAIYRAHVTQAPRPPSAVATGISRDLDAVVLRALAKDPRDRFPDADRLVRALEYVQSDFSGKPREADSVLLDLLRPTAALARPRVPTPEEQARVEILYSEGMAYLENQKYAEAAARFEAALQLDPVHFEARRNRRVARVRQLELAEGAKERTRQASAEEELLRIGLARYAEKRWEEASDMFERVLDMNPDRLEAKRYLYEATERAAAEREARGKARGQAVEAAKRGVEAFNATRFEEAAAAIVEALRLDPENETARRYAELCGIARSNQAGEKRKRLERARAEKDPEAARELLRQALAQDPANLEAKEMLRHLDRREEKAGKSGISLERTKIGLARFAEGDLEGAAGAFAEALRIDEDREEARKWLDRCGARLAEQAEAREALTKLSSAQPAAPQEAPGAAADRVTPSDPLLPIVDLAPGALAEAIPGGAFDPRSTPEPGELVAARAAPAPETLKAVPPPSAGRIPFAGRSNTIQVLDRVLDEAPRGKGAFILLKGKPGVGKTRVLEEFVSRNSYRNFFFLSATCSGDLGDYFGPWKWIALAAIRAVEPVDFLAYTKLAMKFAAEFGRFGEPFRHLAIRNGRTPDLSVPDARIRPLLIELFTAVLEIRPLFITVDAIELADSETLGILERVALMTRERPVVLASAVSQSRAADTNPWARFAPKLREQKLAQEFMIPRLPEDDLRKILGPMLAAEMNWTGGGEAPRAEGRIATEVYRVTDGDLHQVEKICRHLAATGLIGEETGLWRLKKKGPLMGEDLVAGLSEGLLANYRALNARQASTLRWLAISEDGLPFDVLQEVTGLAQAELFHAAHDLVARKMAAEQDERGRKSYGIPSPHLRAQAYDDIPQTERSAMHDRAAAALDRLDRARPERAAAQALKGASADRAVDCCVRAADVALEAGRASEARGWLDRAEPWLGKSRNRAQAGAHAERSARARLACGQPAAALRALTEAIGQGPPPERLAALRYDLARAQILLGRRREAADAIALAREKPGGRRDEVTASLLQARLAILGDDLPTAARHIEAARPHAQAAGLAGPTLALLAEYRFVTGDVKQAQANAQESLEVGGAPDAVLTLARCQIFGGRALAAAARLESTLETCEDRVLEAETRALLAHARVAAARGAAAREQAALAGQAAAAAGAPATQARAHLAAADAALAAEDPAAALESAAAAQALFDATALRSGLARAGIALGQACSAAGQLDRAFSYFDIAAPGATTPELAALLGLARAEATLRAGRGAEARTAFHAVLEHLGKVWMEAGLVARVYAGLAAVHTAAADRNAAIRNFTRAVKILKETELALPFAHVQARYAELLAAAPLTRDAAREGAEIADEAARHLAEAGAKTAEARARAAAASLSQKSQA
ncbi:MAG: protein kinase [Planctomycetes bacterium]|nr:protein kinase [Planctomycetota bacterium]